MEAPDCADRNGQGVGGEATRQGRAHGFRGQRGRIPRKAAREEARADLDSAQETRDPTASVKAARTSRLHRSSRNGRGPKAENSTGVGWECQGLLFVKTWRKGGTDPFAVPTLFR